jgi:hypothetical protein
MRTQDDDLTLRRLRGLTVLQPDASHAERVRSRCQATLVSRPSRHVRWRAADLVYPARVGALLTCALCLGLVAGMIQDVLLVYLRQ